MRDVPELIRLLTTTSVPMAIGLRDWAGVWIGGPGYLTIAFAGLVGIGLATTWRRIFPITSLIVLLLLLIPGGIYHDLQSARYLVPWAGIAALTAAAGFEAIYKRSRVIAVSLLAATLVGFSWGQVRWYRQLAVDLSDQQISACLLDHDIHEGVADYWIAYRLTFLGREQVIVVPDDPSLDRYAPYRARVTATSRIARITRIEDVPPSTQPLCTSSSLAVTVSDMKPR